MTEPELTKKFMVKVRFTLPEKSGMKTDPLYESVKTDELKQYGPDKDTPYYGACVTFLREKEYTLDELISCSGLTSEELIIQGGKKVCGNNLRNDLIQEYQKLYDIVPVTGGGGKAAAEAAYNQVLGEVRQQLRQGQKMVDILKALPGLLTLDKEKHGYGLNTESATTVVDRIKAEFKK